MERTPDVRLSPKLDHVACLNCDPHTRLALPWRSSEVMAANKEWSHTYLPGFPFQCSLGEWGCCTTYLVSRYNVSKIFPLFPYKASSNKVTDCVNHRKTVNPTRFQRVARPIKESMTDVLELGVLPIAKTVCRK